MVAFRGDGAAKPAGLRFRAWGRPRRSGYSRAGRNYLLSIIKKYLSGRMYFSQAHSTPDLRGLPAPDLRGLPAPAVTGAGPAEAGLGRAVSLRARGGAGRGVRKKAMLIMDEIRVHPDDPIVMNEDVMDTNVTRRSGAGSSALQLEWNTSRACYLLLML